MLKEYDVVRLKRSTLKVPPPAGSVGTVLIVHDADPPAYEVEFMKGEESLGWYTVDHDNLELVVPYVPRAR